jgi:hypothetical protein
VITLGIVHSLIHSTKAENPRHLLVLEVRLKGRDREAAGVEHRRQLELLEPAGAQDVAIAAACRRILRG